MRIWRDLAPSEQSFHGGVVTIGNFDGLHLGHQALFREVNHWPKPHVVVTFDPHPVQVLHPDRELKRLFPRSDLQEQLPKYDIDLLVVLPFTKSLAELPPSDFMENKIYLSLQPKHLVVGHDFALGRARAGDIQWLGQWCSQRKVQMHIVPAYTVGTEVVSSRHLRDWLEQGEVHRLLPLLGRPFFVRGRVVPGEGRGRQLEIPTLNLATENELLPLVGVYATRTRFAKETWPSVTNVGLAPTFAGAQSIRVETHVLQKIPDLYGEVIEVDFIRRLRNERKFSGAGELVRQIQDDIKMAKVILGER